jgi:hypothetical protein
MPQKRASGTDAVPHFAHDRSSRVPQATQKRSPGRVSAEHFPHFIATSFWQALIQADAH